MIYIIQWPPYVSNIYQQPSYTKVFFEIHTKPFDWLWIQVGFVRVIMWVFCVCLLEYVPLRVEGAGGVGVVKPLNRHLVSFLVYTFLHVRCVVGFCLAVESCFRLIFALDFVELELKLSLLNKNQYNIWLNNNALQHSYCNVTVLYCNIVKR